MHLHIVFVLLYSVCRSVNVLSCVDVIQSFTYVLRVVILDVTTTAREAIPTACRRYYQESKENKSNKNIWMWLVCCCYFQPAAPIDRLHLALRSGLEVGKPNTTRPTTDEPLTVTAMEVKGKEHDGQTDEQEEKLHRGGGSVSGLQAAPMSSDKENTYDELKQTVRQAPQFSSDWRRVFYETVTFFYFSC